MESPPPYYTPAPKKSKTGLIIGLILGGVCLCCILPIVGLGGAAWWGVTKAKGFVGCTLTFANLQRAVEAYASDHDGHLPKAATWESDVKPYYAKELKKHAKEQQMFAPSPTGGSLGCTNDDATITGISFNKELSGKKISDLKDPYDTIMLFEVQTAGANLNSEYKPLSFESSPKIFNTPRGWYVAHVSGQVTIVGKNGETKSVNINVSSGDTGGSGNN